MIDLPAVIMVWCLNVSPIYAYDPQKGEYWSTPEFNAWAERAGAPYSIGAAGVSAAYCVNVADQNAIDDQHPVEDLGL